MKEQILAVLAKHPNGLRLRSIGYELHVWHCSLAKDVAELEREGRITARTYRDMANMEMYDIWRLASPL